MYPIGRHCTPCASHFPTWRHPTAVSTAHQLVLSRAIEPMEPTHYLLLMRARVCQRLLSSSKIYLLYFSKFAVCPCFVSKKRVKVKYDFNRQCKDILTNFYFFRAMLVQNVVRRVAQAPALARAFTSTVPKPSNTPARKQPQACLHYPRMREGRSLLWGVHLEHYL